MFWLNLEFLFSFSGKNNFMHFESKLPFKVHKIIFFFQQKKMIKKYVSTLPKIFRPVTQKTLIFLFGLRHTLQGRYLLIKCKSCEQSRVISTPIFDLLGPSFWTSFLWTERWICILIQKWLTNSEYLTSDTYGGNRSGLLLTLYSLGYF